MAGIAGPGAVHASPRRRAGPGRALRAIAKVLFGEMVELPRVKELSRFGKVLLAAASVTVLAGLVLLVAAPAGAVLRPGWEIGAAEVIALAGLLTGCCLALHTSRHYLLGVPGIFVSAFVTLLLATFAGLTLYIVGFAPAQIAGVNTSPARQHLAVCLALIGLLAAFLLIAAPWSPYRTVAQPCLAAVAVLAPVLALLAQAGPRAFRTGFGALPALGGDPILLMASVAGLLALPLLVASSIEWVSGCVGAGFRLGTVLDKRKYRWLRAVIVAGVVLWLALGAFGWLPAWLGGHLGAWPLIRDAHPDAWVLAVAVTVLAALFVVRVHARLDLPEAPRAAYIPTCLLFYGAIAVAVWIFYLCVRYLLLQVLPAAGPELALSVCVFAFAVAVLWFALGQRRRPIAVIAGLGACCAVLLGIGFRWPTGALPFQFTPLPFGLGFIGKGLDSAVVLAAAAGIVALFCLGAWLVFLVWAGSLKTTSIDGSPAGRTGYETVVLPLACWALLLLGGALLRMRGGLTLSAFAHPVLPDPVVFTVVAVPVAAIAVLTQWHARRNVALAGLCVVLVMPILAFLPFAIPAAIGPAGRLAVLAIGAPIIYGLTFGGRDINRDSGTERRLGWLAGTSAILVPLLAYLAVVGNQHGNLTSLLTEAGQGAAGAGLGAHLRLVLLLPLLVTFVAASPEPIAELRGRSARSREIQADILALSARDGDLDEIYLDKLRRHLAAASPADQAGYACQLAQRLARSYTPPRQPAHPVPSAGHQAPPGYPPPESVSFALDVAGRLREGKAPAHELARAHAQVTRGLPVPAPDDRAARRAYDTVEVLRCALSNDAHMSEACLDVLVTASGHEVEDAAQELIHGPHEGKEYERNLQHARKEIDAQLSTLGNFQVLEVGLQFMWLAPAMVLDDPPGARQGAQMPGEHPYRYLGAMLAAVAMLFAVLYVISLGVPK